MIVLIQASQALAQGGLPNQKIVDFYNGEEISEGQTIESLSTSKKL